MKKIIATLLALTLIVTMSIGGTVAYLQSTDEQKNVMFAGPVIIDQLEYERAEGVSWQEGAYGVDRTTGITNGVKKSENKLVPFTQNKPIYPAVPKNSTKDESYVLAGFFTSDHFYWGEYVSGGWASNQLFRDNWVSNVMDKMVFVENTGSNDCYFRTIIAFEAPEGFGYQRAPTEASEARTVYNDSNNIVWNRNEDGYTWNENVGYMTLDGTRYFVVVATYDKILPVGNTSEPSLLQIVMKHNTTSEDVEKLNGTYDVLVISQAVQTVGFDSADDALNTAFGNVTVANCAEWFSQLNDDGE